MLRILLSYVWLDNKVSKSQFKVLVKRACKSKNEELKSQISTYKKMGAIRDELVKGNAYFFKESLNSARILFRFRVDLFEAKGNFKHKPDYVQERFLCDSCESERDENVHVLYCPAYASLRAGKSLNNDTHLTEYLHKVIEIRTNVRLNR